MRVLIVFVLMLDIASALNQLPSVNKVDDSPNKADHQQNQANSPPVIFCNRCTVSEPQHDSGKAQNEDKPEKRLYHRYMRATILGVIGGIIGIAILIWQTVLTHKAANAARDTARKLAQIEGATIVPSIELVPGYGHIMFGVLNTGNGNEVTHVITAAVRLRYINAGKSVGWITQQRAEMASFESVPKSPDFNSLKVIQEGFDPVSPGKDFYKDEAFTCEGKDETDKTLLIYGIVKYRDAFNDAREVTFGFRMISAKTFERINLPAYTKST